MTIKQWLKGFIGYEREEYKKNFGWIKWTEIDKPRVIACLWFFGAGFYMVFVTYQAVKNMMWFLIPAFGIWIGSIFSVSYEIGRKREEEKNNE
jgi:hypothetical protein